MCTNLQRVYNRYIHRTLLVDCGKCPACQQAKADRRASRIRNTLGKSEICLFVTLTYQNEFCPYVDTHGLKFGANYDIPIYRDASGRYQRTDSDYTQKFVATRGRHQIGTIPYARVTKSDFSKNSPSHVQHLRNYDPHKIGVCLFQDVQDFHKRLRINLKRKYNINAPYKTFNCSEYGSMSQRPHFHLLLFIPSHLESVFRCAIVQSWPYASKYRTSKFIEQARDCASYVSSYVNSNMRLSSLLSTSVTKQKHSYSHHFGMDNPSFDLGVLLRKIDSGAMVYDTLSFANGVPCPATVPMPQYVIRRYFPFFKGYSRLSVNSLAELLYKPERLPELPEAATDELITSRYLPSQQIGYTQEDYEKICVQINNSYERFHALTGLSRMEYVRYHLKAWTAYKSTILKFSFKEVTKPIDYVSHYDNALDFVLAPDGTFISLEEMCEREVIDKSVFETDPNKVATRVAQTARLAQRYHDMTKQKEVTNSIMALGLELNV